MKKAIILLFLICLFGYSYGQFSPITGQGSPTTLSVIKGGLRGDSGTIISGFPDTSGVLRLRSYAGGLLRVGNNIWMRDSVAQKWILLAGTSLPIGGSYVDTIYRKAGQDSIFYTIDGGSERAIKDSIGGGSGSVEYVVSGASIRVDSSGRTYTINADTGRAATQLVTGGSLNKVADSLAATITPAADVILNQDAYQTDKRFSIRSARLDSLYGRTATGLVITNNAGAVAMRVGSGGGTTVGFDGSVNIDGTTRLATSLTGLLTSNSGTVSNAVSGTDIKTINSTSLLGSGNISITGTPAGSTTEIQFNNAGAFGASSNFAWNNSTNRLFVGTTSTSFADPIVVVGRDANTETSLMVGNSNNGTTGYPALRLIGAGTSASLIGLVPSAHTGVYADFKPSTIIDANSGSGALHLISANSYISLVTNGRATANRVLTATNAGSVLIGTGTTTGASAKLQIDATDKGVLIPRMTASQRTAISSPASGLMLIDSDSTYRPFIYNGSAWKGIALTDDISMSDSVGLRRYGTTLARNLRTFNAGGQGTAAQIVNQSSTTADSSNILIGYVTGNNLTTGYNNYFLGDNAGATATTGFRNIAIGYTAMGSTNAKTGNNNIALGTEAMRLLSSGTGNIAIGDRALRSMSSNTDNIAIGITALSGVTTGGNNVGIGRTAGSNNTSGGITTGSDNVFLGGSSGALINTTASRNTLVGASAIQGMVGNNNTALGFAAGGTSGVSSGGIIGDNNIMIGSGALPMTLTTNNEFTLWFGSATGTGVGGYNGFSRNSSGRWLFNQTTSQVTSVASGAAVEINGNTGGLLIPRLTTTQQNAISSPATGLLLYNTDSTAVGGVMHYTGSAWAKVGGSGGTSPTDYHQSIASVNDSTVRFTKPNGNADTIVFSGLDASPYVVLPPGTTAAGTAPLKFTTQAAGLTTVEQGAMELIGNSLQFTQLAKRRGVQMSQGVLIADATSDNNTTETSALVTAEHGANYLEVGKCEVIRLVGKVSQRSNANATIKFRIKYGGVTIDSVSTPASTLINAGSSFELTCYITVRSTGATGTAKVNTILRIDGVANSPDSNPLITINTTIAQNTTITAQWGEANAANLFTLNQGFISCIEPNK